MRFGLDGRQGEHLRWKKSKSFAVTRERIRQIEAKARRKRRAPCVRANARFHGRPIAR